MTITIITWFLLGLLTGIIVLVITSLISIHCERNTLADEEFVKKLIEKKGWTEARWELKTSYSGKYMRIWCRLYREHIEGE